MNRTGPTNPTLKNLIQELKKISSQKNIPLWRRVADDLERPTRQRRVVNLSRINRYTQEDDIIVVPGKVLGAGNLDHKLTVAAYQFSEGALLEIEKMKGKAVPIHEFMKNDIKGKKIKIIG